LVGAYGIPSGALPNIAATKVTDPSEHARLSALAERITTVYTGYRNRTQKVGRHIPIMRLTPRGGASGVFG
jgi:hypothetical protein